MKKRTLVSVLTCTMLAAAVTATAYADNSDYLKVIPNYDNPVGTFAKGPNGEDAVSADDVNLTDDQYAAIKDKHLKLAMLWAGAGEWYNGMTDGAKEECEKMGIDIVTTADAEFDPAQQATQIETAMGLDPDIILTLPVDPVSGTTAYQPAVDAGVKIAFADNSVNDYVGGDQYVAVCTGDQYGMGRTCADLIADAIGGKGKIGIIYYDTDYTVTNNRDNQFVRSIVENYPDIEIADMKGFAKETATGEVASAMLTQNPDLDAIYVSWDVAAEPVVAEIRSGGYPTKVVTIDLGGNNDLEMAQGGIVYGKSADMPYQIGGTMVKLAALSILGEEAPTYVVSDCIKMTKDNIEESWLAAMNTEPSDDVLKALGKK
ncbi:MAG: substrate-binding domain-containing protein [Lachnospiraceae bacterium]|nr:substrate-binding domain-containing protein [Lachnospiraceae bacterium]MCI7092963.1 substrate-binding domain-containing protein [Lachnospiraceae bacterium]